MFQFQQALDRLLAGLDLNREEARSAFSCIMEGECSEAQIAALLTALRMKGEAVSEIVGAAEAMRDRALPITTRHSGLLDTCGTGGDELRTFNISTTTALVAAAVGIPVPKHGNRGVSSSSGSADVLEQLGVNINLTPPDVSHCIDELKIGFCFAPLIHGAMRHAAPVRKQLRFRTIFNLLGPLTNPARAEFQLIGASRRATAGKLAQALAQLGGKHALVVCGADQLDEISLWGVTNVFEVAGGTITRREWSAETFGLASCTVDDLRIGSPAESAARIRGILAGERGPCRDIVLANSAAALYAAEHVTDLPEAVSEAAAAIDSGRVSELLEQLVTLTNSLSQPKK